MEYVDGIHRNNKENDHLAVGKRVASQSEEKTTTVIAEQALLFQYHLS